jgi:hypothetical protein
MIIEQLYDALLEAGASEPKAKEAARAVADITQIMHSIDKRLAGVEARMGSMEMLLRVNVIATVAGVAGGLLAIAKHLV